MKFPRVPTFATRVRRIGQFSEANGRFIHPRLVPIFGVFTIANGVENLPLKVICYLLAVLIAATIGVNFSKLVIIALPFDERFTLYPVLLNLDLEPFSLTVPYSLPLLPFALVYLLRKLKLQPIFVLKWIPMRVFVVWAILFLGASLFSLINNEVDILVFSVSMAKFCASIGYGFFAVMFVLLCSRSQRDLKSWLRTWTIVGVYAAFVAAIGMSMARLTGQTNPFVYNDSRIQGAFSDPNSFAIFSLVSLGVCHFYNYIERKRIISFSSMVMLLSAAFSFSQSAEIALFATSIAGLIAFARRRYLRLQWAAVSVVVLAVLLPNYTDLSGPPPLPSQSESIDADNEQVSQIQLPARVTADGRSVDAIAMDSRWEIWTMGLNDFISSPINGIGLGQFELGDLGSELHNTVLEVLVETGIIGSAIFWSLFLLIFLSVRERRVDANLILLALLASLIFGLGNSLLNVPSFWLLVGVALGYLLPEVPLWRSK